MVIHIVDRRLNPGSKSLENRQRFLRRAKALVQGAVKKTSEGRDIKDVLEGGEVSIPLDGMHEPRFRREGGTRDMVLPGSTMSRVPPSRRNRGSCIPSRGIVTSPPSRTSLISRSCEVFLTAPCTRDLARRKNR